MNNLATSACLYLSATPSSALGMQPSALSPMFDCPAFDNWKKSQESEGKTQSAIVLRLNEVIRGIGILAKSGRRF